MFATHKLYIKAVYSTKDVITFLFALLRSGLVGGMGWEKMEEGEPMETPVDVQVDSSQLPLVEGPDGDMVFRFYWLDAFEDVYNQPGEHLLLHDFA